jgi:hypothetical protein
MNTADTRTECFSQGFRCGHIDGKDRHGSYVIQEECFFSLEAALYQTIPQEMVPVWAEGYLFSFMNTRTDIAISNSYTNNILSNYPIETIRNCSTLKGLQQH